MTLSSGTTVRSGRAFSNRRPSADQSAMSSSVRPQSFLFSGTYITVRRRHDPMMLIYDCAADASILQRHAVAIVGFHEACERWLRRAQHLARDRVGACLLVISGLAMGMDTEARHAASPPAHLVLSL